MNGLQDSAESVRVYDMIEKKMEYTCQFCSIIIIFLNTCTMINIISGSS